MQSKLSEGPLIGLPPPSAAMCALRMMAQAFLKTVGRRKAERFVKELATIVQHEESVRVLLPKRPAHEREAASRAQEEAAALIRAMLPVLLSAIPPD